jgi:hypothetical protein
MTNSINPNILKNFIVKNIGAESLTKQTAQKYGIDNDKFDEANTDENNYLDLDEMLDDKDIVAQFTVMYQEEMDAEQNVNEEDKKEEETKVKDKNGAGV